MYLADTLSRAHLPDVCACDHELATNLAKIDHTATTQLAVTKDRLTRISYTSADDPVLQVLRETIQQGWPEHKSRVPPCIWAYYDFHDELTIQDQRATYCHSSCPTQRDDVDDPCVTYWNRRLHTDGTG